jgi:hypothetical protein
MAELNIGTLEEHDTERGDNVLNVDDGVGVFVVRKPDRGREQSKCGNVGIKDLGKLLE